MSREPKVVEGPDNELTMPRPPSKCKHTTQASHTRNPNKGEGAVKKEKKQAAVLNNGALMSEPQRFELQDDCSSF